MGLTNRIRTAALIAILALGLITVASVGMLVSSGPAAALTLVEVASGLTAPLFITHAGDGSSRLYLVEQGGLIRILENGTVSTTPFLDISNLTTADGERGLLGLAFHPHYKTNRHFFVYYTDQNGDINIARYSTSTSNPLQATPSSAKVILKISHHEFSNHNGGMLAFGPDGYLYIGVGDGGSAGDPHGNAQSLNSLLGKILRIDVNHGKRYTIPATNPFLMRSGAKREIYAYGMRNPWRFSFDRKTRRLFVGDVGQDAIEEVDIIQRGKNYGWNIREGNACYNPSSNCRSHRLSTPIATYPHSEGESVTGGYVYRGSSIPTLIGKYIFGDFVSGKVWSLTRQPSGSWQRELLLNSDHSISSFGVDKDGELYLVDLVEGKIYRLTGS